MNSDFLKPVPEGTNPQEVIEQSTGKYDDAANKLSPEQRFPHLPQAPDPNPFGNVSGPTGPGR